MKILFGEFFIWDWESHIRTLYGDGSHNITFKKFGRDNITDYEAEYDIIIPLISSDMHLCNSYINDLNKVICCHNSDTINLLNNKLDFILWMIAHGFEKNIPELYLSQINEVTTIHTPFPPFGSFIVKNTQGFGGHGSYIISSKRGLRHSNSNFIVQKYIDHPEEYSGHFYVKAGEIKYYVIFCANNSSKNYITHGPLQNYVDKTSEVEIESLREIFKELKYNGFACVDFKIKDGILYIFEINPRLGGSIVKNRKYLREIIDAAMDP